MQDLIIPPGPKGDGSTGCLPDMRRNPMQFLEDVAKEYGGIACVNMGSYSFYLVTEPKLIKELLVDNSDHYRKSTHYKQIRMVLGEGMLLSELDIWKQQRTHAQPKFTAKSLQPQVDWIADLAKSFIDNWDTNVESDKPLELEYQFNLLTQLLAGVWVMGRGYESRAANIFNIYNQIRLNWPEMTDTKSNFFKIKNIKRELNFRHALKQLNSSVYDLLDDYPGIIEQDVGFLKHLINDGNARKSIKKNKRAYRDQMLTLFVAAFETTATSLCWTMYALDQHPEIRQLVYQEVDNVLGKKIPTAELLNKLNYTENVIKESLRLYSSIHSVSRVALVKNTVGGYTVPKGMTVTVSFYATHRLPEYWENPYKFDPDRFTKERSVGRSRFAYLPFGAGHRSCIGSYLAIMQSKLIVALIAQRYRLSLTPGHKIEPHAATTMRPKFGVKMNIERLAV